MKKLISLGLLVCIIVMCFAGCGKKEKEVSKNRILYNVELSDYVDLGEYKGIKVDTSSDKFATYYDEVIDSDVNSNEFFTREETSSGKIEDGDVANIDYVGKKDGVAFEGGTADGYDLEIGSGTFIDGFEEGLIGVEIGKTVDLDLTFPENYGNEELAGADVVFTVKVNSAQKKVVQKPEEYYSKLEFETVEAYLEDVKNRAVENYLLDKIIESSKINKYPEKDIETLYTAFKKMIETTLSSQYGTDLPTYLDSMGQTEEEFKKTVIDEQIKIMMDSQMIMYGILDAEKIEIKESDINKQVKAELEKIGNSSVTEQAVKDYYGEYYFEDLAATEKAIEVITKSAKIS